MSEQSSAGTGRLRREQQITTAKLASGHYRITREDGYSIEVRRSVQGDWYQISNMARFSSLGSAKFDMSHGYMARDSLLARQESQS